MHADNAPLRLKINTETYSKLFRDGLGGRRPWLRFHLLQAIHLPLQLA